MGFSVGKNPTRQTYGNGGWAGASVRAGSGVSGSATKASFYYYKTL